VLAIFEHKLQLLKDHVKVGGVCFTTRKHWYIHYCQ